MSQENVESVRAAYEALNRRDFDAFEELATADFEWSPAMTRIVEGDSFRGREGLEEYASQIDDTWEEVGLFPDEFRDLGDRVLVCHRVELRGRGSGVPVTAQQTAIIDFRDGLISRSRSYFDHDEALKAVGLEE